MGSLQTMLLGPHVSQEFIGRHAIAVKQLATRCDKPTMILFKAFNHQILGSIIFRLIYAMWKPFKYNTVFPFPPNSLTQFNPSGSKKKNENPPGPGGRSWPAPAVEGSWASLPRLVPSASPHRPEGDLRKPGEKSNLILWRG